MALEDIRTMFVWITVVFSLLTSLNHVKFPVNINHTPICPQNILYKLYTTLHLEI